MRLREVSPADLDRLHSLDQVCFPPDIAYSKRELASFLGAPSAFSVIIESPADQTCGATAQASLLGFAVVRSLRSGGRALLHVITIDVEPKARRQGIGRRLVGWMEEKARALQVQVIRLEVADNNEDAQRFYQRLGFEEVGRIPGYYSRDLDARVMERKLV